jgi:cyclophilin family peptidyl-prolyl cis-trans isomerase/HEAT repeat protein
MRSLPLCVGLMALAPSFLPAQDPVLVGELAPIIMAEDRRVLDLAVLAPALEHPDPIVRRAAVVAIGRIGGAEGVVLVAPRLRDRDPAVVTEAFFALGLLRQPAAVPLIIERVRLGDSLSVEALRQAASALARIGGTDAAAFLADVIGGGGAIEHARRTAMLPAALIDAWRLGTLAPTDAILPFTRDTGVDYRWRASYSLGRLVAPGAGQALLLALRDRSPLIRETAARALTRRLADTAGLPSRTVLSELERAMDDPVVGVRTNAVVAAATFGDSSATPRAVALLRDQDRNVRVAAATALASMGGALAVTALEELLADPGAEWGVRRTALGSLARLDRERFFHHASTWLRSAEPFDRLAALQSWGGVEGAAPDPFRIGLSDQDPRVQAAALAAWGQSARNGDPELRAVAERAWNGPAPAVRAVALRLLADTASDAVLDLLATAWQSGNADLREAALSALIRLGRGDRQFIGRLTTPARRAFLSRPDDPVLRGMAQRGLPLLAARWGGVGPIETGRTLQDYRELVARFVLASDNPRVAIDVVGRGRIELELLGREAPLTVANFLRLVDRRYFDNSRWHRVVPNFVVQDGDPTGTGSGGPGWSIRDEINRLRYDSPRLGMALSGPDTGGSQWFINLSPQPHLDGGYTIFGQVTGGHAVLYRVVQGDLIRSIQRTGPS